MNVSDLQMVLGLSYSTNNCTLSEVKEMDYNLHGSFSKDWVSTLQRGSEMLTWSVFQERGRD